MSRGANGRFKLNSSFRGPAPGRGPGMTGQSYARAAFASWIAFQTFCGVSGVGSCVMPNSANASITPLAMQGGPPIAPDSPQPLAPRGLVRQGADSSSVTAIEGMSSALGTQ